MSQRQRVRFSRAAQIGLIAIVFAVGAAVAIYFGATAVRGGRGYQTAVRFPTAAGVGPGAQVFMNGVNIGTVSRIRILPDASVDFIIHVFRDTTSIPKNAQFTVRNTLGGAPEVMISAVPQTLTRGEILPKHVAPVSQQPVGTPPMSIEAFMLQGRALGNRLTGILSKARPYGKPLLASLQGARTNTAATTQEMRAAAPALFAIVQSTMTQAKSNIADAQQVLRRRDQSKLVTIAAAFQRSANDMKQTASALGVLKRNPQTRANLRESAAQLRTASANLARLSDDLGGIAKNSQTKAQLRDAGERFRALLKRL